MQIYAKPLFEKHLRRSHVISQQMHQLRCLIYITETLTKRFCYLAISPDLDVRFYNAAIVLNLGIAISFIFIVM